MANADSNTKKAPKAPLAHRPTIMGTRHVIAAGHYLAAQAGFDILEAGGNAIDAGVAAGLALCVVETDTVNFGGVAPIMIYHAKTREVFSIDGVGVWPKAITPDYFQKHHGGKIPIGIPRSVVPAAPDAWISALERFGTMSFSDVASSAISLARDGFPMYQVMSEFISNKRAGYERWPSTRKVFLPKGRAPLPGEMFVQKDLGRTLQYLADVEKAHRRKGRRTALRATRDAFYNGDIATAIVKFHKQNGGLMRMDDFIDYKINFEPTVKTKFNGIEVHACGPWSQGPVLPMALNILKDVDLKALGHNSPRYIHVLTEALKLALADRHQHFGDPKFIDVPMQGLMSEKYAAYRRSMLRLDRAWTEMPPPGDPATLTNLPYRWMTDPMPDDAPGPAGPGDTTYLCCVDRYGNAFSSTPSDNTNTSPIVTGVGIVCSGRGTQSSPDPTHPCSVAPGKRPRLTPSPAIALKNGKVLMPFGTPGGDVQPQAMLQMFLNINVFGMDAQVAIEAPRFSGVSFPVSSGLHSYFPGRLYVEARVPQATRDELTRLGHKVHLWDEWSWLAGGGCIIAVDQKNGVLHGAADPRRSSYALGR